MASYNDLYNLRDNSELINRVTLAVVIAAETIAGESDTVDNHVNRLKWAKSVFVSPDVQGKRMSMAVIAANNDKTIEQITGASDVAIQANVGDRVDVFADGS